ncbi:MAG: hypothetical protein ACYSSN_04575, partial [Planctomycetota bacterium]
SVMPITKNHRKKIAGACAKPSELQTTDTNPCRQLPLFTHNPSRQQSQPARLLFADKPEKTHRPSIPDLIFQDR